MQKLEPERASAVAAASESSSAAGTETAAVATAMGPCAMQCLN